MKILRINSSGYKGLKEGFEISFLASGRVSPSEENGEVLSKGGGLNLLTAIGLVGANASGKSTVLRLVEICSLLLDRGSATIDDGDFSLDTISLSFDFLSDDDAHIYRYGCKLGKRGDEEGKDHLPFNPIREETLLEKPVNAGARKNSTLSFASASSASRQPSRHQGFSEFLPLAKEQGAFTSIFFEARAIKPSWIKAIHADVRKRKLFYDVLSILDDSMQTIEAFDSEHVRIKKRGMPERIVEASRLGGFLSSGTLRGIRLFFDAFTVLENGSMLIVDEIETSFHANLVANLALLFLHSETNPKGARLLFSTHYAEILDLLYRNDSVFVLRNAECGIEAKNMLEYGYRRSISHSNLINANAFGTMPGYDDMMGLRKDLLLPDIGS